MGKTDTMRWSLLMDRGWSKSWTPRSLEGEEKDVMPVATVGYCPGPLHNSTSSMAPRFFNLNDAEYDRRVLEVQPLEIAATHVICSEAAVMVLTLTTWRSRIT